MKERFLYLWLGLLLFSGCTVQKRIGKAAQTTVLGMAALQTAHIGISIYEPATNTYWYNHQGDKYFVPASNTKIPTCYAAMKYLGDSLPGLKVTETKHQLFIQATGDPTLLHDDFKQHPVYDFVKRNLDKTMWFGAAWEDRPLGLGWSWSDYASDYMAERSAFPVYGNVVSFKGQGPHFSVTPKAFAKNVQTDSMRNSGFIRDVDREHYANYYKIMGGGNSHRSVKVPFITSDTLNLKLFIDTLLSNNTIIPFGITPPVIVDNEVIRKYVVHSQPTDSLLKPMMHRSDNFFAEQTLLMVSNEVMGVMSDARITDTLLKTDSKDLPHKPRWVDGSGLSRYNLFTPQDFVAILKKMQNEFGINRMKHIFPSGNEGTLSNYFVKDSNFIYAKTGTLSGVVALSGFLYTQKNKLLLFSILVNNHQTSAATVRKAVEQFLQAIRSKN